MPFTDRELKRSGPSLIELMQAFAVIDHAWTAPRMQRRRLSLTLEGVEAGLADAGLVLRERCEFRYPDTAEREYEWLSIPIFADQFLPGLDHDAQRDVAEKAWSRYDRTRLDEARWVAFLAEPANTGRSGSTAVQGRSPKPIGLAPYDALIEQTVKEAHDDHDVLGVLLTGSIARGDALPGADLDLRMILTDGMSRPFRTEWQLGVHLEAEYNDEPAASRDIETNPMNVYAYLDGRILYDPRGILARLTRQAQERFENYRCPERERARVAYWLASALEKIKGAMAGDDTLKAAYVAGTTSWKILEGLWATNDRPTPPNSSVRPHLVDLQAGPLDVAEKCEKLSSGKPKNASRRPST